MHTRDETRERERKHLFVVFYRHHQHDQVDPEKSRALHALEQLALLHHWKKLFSFSPTFFLFPSLACSLSLSPQSIYISIYISLSPVQCAPFVTPWIWTQRCHVTIPRLCWSCPILLSFFSPNSKVTVWKDCVTTDAVLEKTSFVRWVRVCVRCYFNPPPRTPPPPVLSLSLSPAHNSLSLSASLSVHYLLHTTLSPSFPGCPPIHPTRSHRTQSEPKTQPNHAP